MTDPFDDIVAGVKIEIDETDVLNVSTLTIEELISLKQDLEQELYDSKQALQPDAQHYRDIHSLRNAVQVELAKRI